MANELVGFYICLSLGMCLQREGWCILGKGHAYRLLVYPESLVAGPRYWICQKTTLTFNGLAAEVLFARP